ncbi:BTAD domain-containing putative transcriptional regulator [Egicoccus sp. AB-alg2]|uniref:BTAD domain-containing putative transcriptional regulator n=1 Tax=Egicoccus sp. AB-alg2 TaxID=3242693 RepID=UPI00359E07F3
MDFRLLGPLEVRRSGTRVALGAPKLRSLLILLLLDVGRAVPSERLVADLWGEEPPPQPMVSLRSYVSNLRRLLQQPGRPQLIVTSGRGYALDVEPERIDVHRFERLAKQGREAVAAAEPATGVEVLDAALALWRGDALVDVAAEAYAQPVVAKLDELRLTVEEDRFDALLALGRHLEVVPELEAHVGRHRLRERPRRQLMLALHRAGRTPDALRTHTAFRAELVEELGLDPSPEIAGLADRILRQDPSLDAPAQAGWAGGTAVTAAAGGAGGGGGGGEIGTAVPVEPAGTSDGRRPSALLPGVVGRDAERRQLVAAVERLATGEGGLVLLAGEPGIGKTALLREVTAAASATGVPHAWGRCLDADGVPAFWPWIEVLRHLAADLDTRALRSALAGAAAPVTQLVPELAARIGTEPVALGGDPGAARFALYDAVATFLGRLAATAGGASDDASAEVAAGGPDGAASDGVSDGGASGSGVSGGGVLVVLDDLHWADPPTLQLVEFLAARAPAAGVLVAGSYRSAAAERTPALDAALAGVAREPATLTLELGALGADDVAAIATEVAGTPPSDAVLADLVHRSGGNPFFTRQLAALAVERGGVTDGRGGVPVGVRHVLLRRIQLLPEEVRRTLELAAVLGQEFDARTVAAAGGVDVLTVLDHLDVAIQHALVEVGQQHASAYRFVHALVRETLDGELTPGRAARLHAAAADALEQLEPVPVTAVAQHLWQAADVVEPLRVVHHLRAAADEALALFAYEQGEQHLRRALHVLSHAASDDPATELAVRLRLVQVLTSGRGWVATEIDEVAGRRVRELVGRVGLDGELVSLWWSLWTGAMTRGQLDTAAGLAADMAKQAAGDDVPPVVHVASHLANAYTCLFRGADLEVVRGQLAAAREAESRTDAAALAVTPEHLSVSIGVAATIFHALAGEETATLGAVEELVARARATGSTFSLGYALLFAGWGMAALDRPADARRHTDECLALCEQAGLQYLAMLTTPLHGWARARTGGDPAVEAARVAEACRYLDEAGQQHALSNWRLLLAEILLLAGDRESARDELARAVAVGEAIGEQVYGRQLVRVQALVEAAA